MLKKMQRAVNMEETLLFVKISRRARLKRYGVVFFLFILSGVSLYYMTFVYEVSVGLFILGLVFLIFTEISLYNHRAYITNMEVTERIGLLSRRIKTVPMDEIVDIVITQGKWERLLDIGEVHVNTSEDKKYDEIVVRNTARPFMVKKLIESIANNSALRQGPANRQPAPQSSGKREENDA